MDDLLQQRAREVRVFPVVRHLVGLFELLLTILNVHLQQIKPSAKSQLTPILFMYAEINARSASN